MIYGMEYKKEYINFETPMLRSDLCGYSDVYTYIYIYIYMKGKITIVDTNVDT